jgi:hypothetical protein
MIQDYDTGSKVNLIPQTETDNVEDIYSELLNPINNAINKFGIENIEYFLFKDIKLTRKHIKQPIMTKTYNNTVKGITSQLINTLEYEIIEEPINNNDLDPTIIEIPLDNKDKKKNKIIKKKIFLVPTTNGIVKLKYVEVFMLAQIIYKQIFISLPSLKKIYTYFIKIVQLMVKFKIPVI